jgi:hypothetical protein
MKYVLLIHQRRRPDVVLGGRVGAALEQRLAEPER